MNWLLTSLYWYIVVFLLGLVFLPLTKKVFGRFWDWGYPFAKTLAILFVTYAIFVLGTAKILAFTQTGIIFIIGVFLFINIFLHFKKRRTTNYEPQTIVLIIFEEILFLASFLLWVYVRGQEPSIHSLEKFMDFGFINSILRSKYFPPADIWYAGYPINYYYFGHLTGAVLIKLSGIKTTMSYNLILATLFALGVTQVFSLIGAITTTVLKTTSLIKTIFLAALGSFIVNLGGNLQTIYVFTSGYPNEKPIPFWEILSGFNPAKYWYPNATRFIPLTIHEFPSYSYVVADIHGHVFDIPFVLLTIAILFLMYVSSRVSVSESRDPSLPILKRKQAIPRLQHSPLGMTMQVIFLGFLTAVHYMTNAFDGPIYMLLTIIVFYLMFKFSRWFFIAGGLLIVSFFIFSFPFSYHFKPFITGIGVNCSPDFLTNIGRLGPFIFEKDKCQVSSLWMLFVLWGFFWVSFILFVVRNVILGRSEATTPESDSGQARITSNFIFLLFSFGTFLIIIPEFFYIKDIYPAHFRANTMFKLGYQAFIMMGIASAYTFFIIKSIKRSLPRAFGVGMTGVWIFFLFFVAIYPAFSIPSYYGNLTRPVELDGQVWLNNTYPEDGEIIDFLNRKEKDQPVILEAQGDSYTDYERISAFTGLPTVAGWFVHEWLWRGSSNIVGSRIPEVVNIYESKDVNLTKTILQKYHVKYVIISSMEKKKYPNLNESKFLIIGRLIFRSSNGFGAIYQVD